ncbi:MAG: helix-turn-helix transcriptional regulator [Clostridia bacterium]|nr:helix-turn-helix transcriptional regulator [Clostridia bacterium]
MTFKEKLAILRKTKGLTQDGFAKAIGVSRQSVYKWESGVSYPEIPKLLEIKALFGISLDDLFDDSFEVAVPEKKKRARKEVTEKLTPPEAEGAEIKEETKEEPAPAKEIAPETEKAEGEEERKVGFFGRLFGRK